MNSLSRNFTLRIPPDTVGECLAAYRTALQLFGAAEPTAFLPPREHPRYLEIFGELLRLDLEQGWKIGKPTSLDAYRARYPEFFADSVAVFKIAQQEFLLRRQAGENPSLSEYRMRFNVASDDWPTMRAVRPASKGDIQLGDAEDIAVPSKTARQPDAGVRGASVPDDLGKTRPGGGLANPPVLKAQPSEPEIVWKLDEVMSVMPDVGAEFQGFTLLAELGKGAFGKVFLARQTDLHGRHVALKIATDLFGESQTLAQLQHTHIVPIYSFHNGQPFQAVCMPYLGSTTLAHVLEDIRLHKSLPASGRSLLSTLNDRKKKSTQRLEESSKLESSQPAGGDSSNGTRGSEAAVLPSRDKSAPASSALLELEGLSYVDAILWLAVRLTDGLAHAHERGIIHRDLKPANILLTEDGLPMLVDFNLAHDTKLRGSAAAASIGGTLPYMAPEHLEAFRGGKDPVDGRSDLYSLGVILFELLTGANPFPTYRRRPVKEVVEQMILDRRQTPPRLRSRNQGVPPAIEAILRHCLQPNPADRYQTARDLQEDLQRQLAHLPLKHAGNPSLRERMGKFRRRHPRLTSISSVAAIALVLLTGLTSLLAMRDEQFRRLEAQATLTRFEEDAQTAYFLLNARSAKHHLEEGERSARATLEHFGVLQNAAWRDTPTVKRLPAGDRARLEEEVGQTLLLLAHAQQIAAETESDPRRQREKRGAGLQYCLLAESCWRDDQAPQALWKQQGKLLEGLQEREKAQRCFERAEKSHLKTAQDRFLSARLLAEEGKFREALPLIREALKSKPQDFNLHLLQGVCHDHLSQPAEALACYRTCIALRPKFHGAYFNRGLTSLRQNDHAAALADFDQVARLAPDFVEVYPHRALAHEGLRDHAAALADLTAAVEKGVDQTRIYFMRARIHENIGDRASAKKDFAEGLRREPRDELSWIARGNAYESTDPKRSLHDFDQALVVNPRSLAALHNKAVILARHFQRVEEAVRTLDLAVKLYPDDARPRTARGVYLARLGKREAALKDAEQALQIDNSPLNLYLTAGIYALTSRQEPDDQKEAMRLLSAALRNGCGYDYLDIDRDLDPIRASPTFRRVIDAARAMRATVQSKRS